MAVRIWQQLGAFVNRSDNLSQDQLERFARAGGRWIVPTLLGDDRAGPVNVARLGELQARCGKLGIRVGGWFNGWGGDPHTDALTIAGLVREHRLALSMLDLEAPYHYPEGRPNAMPELLEALRHELPSHPMCVTSYGKVDRGMIWRDFRRLGVRFAPQWYSYIYSRDGSYDPANAMRDLKQNGATDPNIADPEHKGVSGLPLSYVHGVIEVTGLERSDLADEIHRVTAAKAFGYTYGLQLYLLENAPATDFPLVQAQRGTLFLV